MIAVAQRVSKASVTIDGVLNGEIDRGLLILVGIEDADEDEDILWLSQKLANLRIFSDQEDKMNLSVKDVGGKVLIVSQFTLHASTKKGNRPSFIKAARPEKAIPIYEKFIKAIEVEDIQVETGEFGANMQVALINDGPVTILIDSKNRV